MLEKGSKQALLEATPVSVFSEAVGPNGHLLCLDVNKEYTDQAQEYWKKAGIEDRITLKLGPAA